MQMSFRNFTRALSLAFIFFLFLRSFVKPAAKYNVPRFYIGHISARKPQLPRPLNGEIT